MTVNHLPSLPRLGSDPRRLGWKTVTVRQRPKDQIIKLEPQAVKITERLGICWPLSPFLPVWAVRRPVGPTVEIIRRTSSSGTLWTEDINSQILSYHQLEELSGCWHSWKDCCRLIPGHPVGSQQPIKEFHMHFLVHFILHPMLRGEGVSRAGSTGDTGSGLFSFTCFLFLGLNGMYKGISVPKGEWK